MKKILLIFVITVLSLAVLFEGACYLFGAEAVYSFCVGVVVLVAMVALPLVAAQKKSQPYWER